MKRLFAAVKIIPDPGFLEQFRVLRHELAHEKIKWVEEKNIHITVKFLGETPESGIPSVSELLQSLSEHTPAFSFRLEGLGIFGSSYQPRVVWTGIRPHEQLASLMKLAKERFSEIGFPADRQNTVPHLTLGRIKFLRDKDLFQDILDENRDICSGPIRVTEMILFESILHPSGPEYSVTGKFPFSSGT